MGAMVAKNNNSILKATLDRPAAAGKSKKLAILNN